MSEVRDEELKRAQLVALIKVQQKVNECDRDRYGKINFKLTNKDIANVIGNSVDWVKKYKKIYNKTRNQSEEKSDEEIFNNEIISRSRKGKGRPTKFTVEEIKEVTVNCANKRRRSTRKTSKRFNNNRTTKTMSKTTVWELRRDCGMHPYHRSNAPMISRMNKEDRCALAQYFIAAFEIGILHPLHLIFTDEFMIYMHRKVNTLKMTLSGRLIFKVSQNIFDITSVPENQVVLEYL